MNDSCLPRRQPVTINAAIALIGLLTAIVSGCANVEQKPIVRPESSAIAKGDIRLAARDFSAARQFYEDALSDALVASKDEYLLTGLYLQKVVANSRLAFIDLHEGNVDTAGSKYRNAIELLRKDFEAHQSLLAERRKANETGDEIKKGLLAGLAGLGLSRLEDGVSNDILSEIGVFSAAGTLIDRVINVPPPQNQVATTLASDSVSASLQPLRIPVIPDTDYLRYVGRVVAGEISCTGSLVGPGLVLTNAHCIFDGGVDYNKGPTTLKPGGFKFQREWLYQNDQFDVKTFYTHNGLEGDWDGQIKNDWVILQLFEQKSGKLFEGYLDAVPDISAGFSSEARNTVNGVFIPGYSSDVNEGVYLTLDAGCELDPQGLAGSIVLHNCNTFSGSSGAPVLHLDAASRPRVVSVNVGKKGGTSAFRGIMVPPKRWYPTLQRLLGKS